MIDEANGSDALHPNRLDDLKDELLVARAKLGMCEYLDSYAAVLREREHCNRRIAHLERLIAELEP